MNRQPQFDERVRTLRRLAAQAAPGPWYFGTADDTSCMGACYVSSELITEDAWPNSHKMIAITRLQEPNIALNDWAEENAHFIAAARQGVPMLCDALESTSRETARIMSSLRELLGALVNPPPDAQWTPVQADALARARLVVSGDTTG